MSIGKQYECTYETTDVELWDEQKKENSIYVFYNRAGVRLGSEWTPFTKAVKLTGKGVGADQGVERWVRGSDGSYSSMTAGLVDVNGDGILDRVYDTGFHG